MKFPFQGGFVGQLCNWRRLVPSLIENVNGRRAGHLADLLDKDGNPLYYKPIIFTNTYIEIR